MAAAHYRGRLSVLVWMQCALRFPSCSSSLLEVARPRQDKLFQQIQRTLHPRVTKQGQARLSVTS